MKELPHQPLVHQEKLGKYDAYFILPDSDRVYLTFDEGYEYGYTPAILDTLKEKNVSAVFFVTGHFVKTHPDLVRRMIDEGHVLGNHSNKHPNYADLPAEAARSDGLHEMVKDFDYENDPVPLSRRLLQRAAVGFGAVVGYKSVFCPCPQ